MSKKIVVSALFGGHDYIKDPVLDGFNEEWEYHLFTDDESLESEYWQIHIMDGNRAIARDIKINTHKYIGYSICLWIDASIVLKGNPDDILNELEDANFLFKIHPKRETVSAELKACIKYGKIEQHQASELDTFYQENGYSENVQRRHLIYETGMYLKRNTSETIEFCVEWHKMTLFCFERDQLALPYLIYKTEPKFRTFMESQFWNWGALSAHSKNYNLLEDVRYTQPYAIDGNLGRAYNESADGLHPDEWICIQDQDICMLDSRQKQWISMCIFDNPEFDILTCMTNRLADTQQLVGAMYDNRDIVAHKRVTVRCWEQFNTKVNEATRPTAGLFMLMRVRTLRAVGFKNGLMYLDTDFYKRAIEIGFKVGIMKGIYVFHYYRFAEGKNNIKHLQRVGH